MKIRLCLSLIVMLLWAVAARATEPQATLSDLLSSPDCVSSCWLGLYIGMPVGQMLEILNANNMAYLRSTIGGPEGGVSYTITGGYSHPYVYPDSYVYIFLDRDRNVGTVWITLDNIFISDVIAAYGSPTHILDVEGNISLAYPRQGLVFLVSSDGSSIYDVHIQTEQHIIEAYINDAFADEFAGCIDAVPLCSVATATPTPEITATPAHLSEDAHALKDMLFPLNCTQACYFGMQPEITTRQEVESLLNQAQITPDISFHENLDNSEYTWDLPAQTPFTFPLGRGNVYIANGKVITLGLTLQIPVSVIYEAFGAPDVTTNDGETDVDLIYKNLGIAFLLSRNADLTRTAYVILASANSSYETYVAYPPDIMDMPCTTYGSFPCIVPTATPSAQ